jgi:hypothetical protein
VLNCNLKIPKPVRTVLRPARIRIENHVETKVFPADGLGFEKAEGETCLLKDRHH